MRQAGKRAPVEARALLATANVLQIQMVDDAGFGAVIVGVGRRYV